MSESTGERENKQQMSVIKYNKYQKAFTSENSKKQKFS